MSQIRIYLDFETLKVVDRMATASDRKRDEFVRQTVKDATFRIESERMREAYRLQPDSAEDSEIWVLPDDWKESTAWPEHWHGCLSSWPARVDEIRSALPCFRCSKHR